MAVAFTTPRRTYLHELEPNWSIDMYERMNGAAENNNVLVTQPLPE
ncbi:hypothetical protein AB6846_27825 [Serratia proteamaculans]